MKLYWFQYTKNFDRLDRMYQYRFEYNNTCKRKDSWGSSGNDILTEIQE